MEYQIDIDGYIGAYGYSKQYVRSVLEANKNNAVNVRINSLGGSLDDALDMAARFNEHGNVTVYMYGYCASAATVASLGAANVIIDENAFYLAHKVMNWVDIWGMLNADEMQQTIEQLEQNKQDNDKMDLVLARMYAKKSGKPVSDILDVLTKGAWLTANEVADLGFVDGIGKGLSYKAPTINEKLNALGLPLPFNGVGKPKGVFDTIKNLISKTNVMLKQFLNLNTLLKVDGFESKENGITLTEDQMTAIDNELKANADKVNSLSVQIAEKDKRIVELEDQVNALQQQPAEPDKPVEPKPSNASAKDMYNLVKNLI